MIAATQNSVVALMTKPQHKVRNLRDAIAPPPSMVAAQMVQLKPKGITLRDAKMCHQINKVTSLSLTLTLIFTKYTK